MSGCAAMFTKNIWTVNNTGEREGLKRSPLKYLMDYPAERSAKPPKKLVPRCYFGYFHHDWGWRGEVR